MAEKVSERFLEGGGEATRLILSRDWTHHPLGPPEAWTSEFRTALSLVLNSPESMILAWGPDLHFFFNEAYFPLLGPRLSWAMGARFDEVWADGMDQARPIIEDAMAGRSKRFIDLPWKLATDRGAADTWWTFSYSRVLGAEGKVAGVFILTTETTQAVVNAASVRSGMARQAFLLDLEQRMRTSSDPAKVLQIVTEALGRQLNVDQASFAELDPDVTVATIEHEWNSGAIPSNRGSHMIEDFGKDFAADLRAGALVAIDDVTTDPRTNAPYALDTLRRVSIGALVTVPIYRAGRLHALITLHSHAPRPWTFEDTELVKEVADRVWSELERSRAEVSLRDLNANLAEQVAEQTRERDQMWRNSRDPFLVSDLAGRWLRVSPAWSDILGWTEAELVGRTSEWLEHPDDRARTRDEVESLSGGELGMNFVNRLRARDGSYRAFAWMSVKDGDRLFCVARDVTGDQALAEERLRLEEQLRQSQKLEAIGQLTGGVAHDFNNMLTVIRGSVDLLKRPDVTEERRRRYVSAIEDTTDRATKLTSQLLAFARRQTLSPQLFDVSLSLRGIGEMIGTLIGSRIDFAVVVPDAPLLVLADRIQFDTAIVNMAINARDAMDGLGRLTLRVAEVSEIPASGSHSAVHGDYVAVSVADTGVGIESELLQRVFEPFFSTKTIGAGTGLGLSQVFGFAKQTGGDVHVTSRPGEGATFTLYLPRDISGAFPDNVREERHPATGGDGLRVLVVEDNAEVGDFVATALRDLGYESFRAESGDAALELLATGRAKFHIVFTDVMMPGISGLELAARVRDLYPDLPVVLTSGYSEVLAQQGPSGFELLQKPYAVDELSRTLRRAIMKAAASGSA